MKKLISIAILLLGFLFSEAKPVTIHGNAPEYKNATLTFNTCNDYITFSSIPLATTKIDSLGNFSLTIDTDKTIEIFALLGIFKAMMYIEPGESYEITLPPREDKTMVNELDLFFEEEPISIGVKNKTENELNYLIYSFNNNYETFTTKSFNWLYIFKDKATIDSLEHSLDSLLPKGVNQFFDDYRYYKIAMLRHFVYEKNRMTVTNNYLKDKPVLYNNPSYMHFFNQVWNDYFITEYTSELGKKLYTSVVEGKSPSLVQKNLNEHIALRDPALNELILLRGLYDAFEKPKLYPRRTLHQTLDSIIITSKVPLHKIIASNMEDRTKTLEIGEVPDNFTLPNQDSTLVSFNSFRGKYVYLNFCRSESFTCMQHYRLLKVISDTFAENLEIITVSNDADFSIFTDFLNKNKDYNWSFVYAENEKDIFKEFNIKALPSYFLFDRDGKLIMNPTSNPDEGFIYQFEQILNWNKQKEAIEKTHSKFDLIQD